MYRSIYCKIFDDPDYQSLDKNSKLVLLTLRLCSSSGPSAIFRYYKGVLAEQTGLTEDEVSKALDTLCHTHWIGYDMAIVWVKNGLKYEPSMTLSNSKHKKSIEKHLRSLPKSEIILSFCKHYGIDPSFLPYAIGYSIPIRYPMANTEPEPDTERDTDITPPTPLEGDCESQEIPDEVFESKSKPTVNYPPDEIFEDLVPKPNPKAEKKKRLELSFEVFWMAYPKRVAKADALKRWLKIEPSDELVGAMIKAIQIDKASEGWKKNKGQFIPHPATWLNGARWNDEREESEEDSAAYEYLDHTSKYEYEEEGEV